MGRIRSNTMSYLNAESGVELIIITCDTRIFGHAASESFDSLNTKSLVGAAYTDHTGKWSIFFHFARRSNHNNI